jgi:hypothetical protein
MKLLDKAAGLDHRELTARSLWLPTGSLTASRRASYPPAWTSFSARTAGSVCGAPRGSGAAAPSSWLPRRASRCSRGTRGARAAGLPRERTRSCRGLPTTTTRRNAGGRDSGIAARSTILVNNTGGPAPDRSSTRRPMRSSPLSARTSSTTSSSRRPCSPE